MNIISILLKRAKETPNLTAYTFMHSTEGNLNPKTITYQELLVKSVQIARSIDSTCAGDNRVLLLFPPSIDYVCGFLGCLIAGKIAVPAYPPKNNRHLDRIKSILADSGSQIILSDEGTRTKFHSNILEGSALSQNVNWIVPDCDDLNRRKITGTLADLNQSSYNDIAFLQYTSGSTSLPKGVALTHQNLISNLAILATEFETDSTSVGASWLPPYHDMGLIGGILLPLYSGFNVFLLSPVSFVQSPIAWLKLISDNKVTISPSPNFGYDLCTQKITTEEMAGLDLSSWKFAITGAELIRPETVEGFVNKFGPYGFNLQAFYPCYGLAESTLIVTGKSLAKEPLRFEKISVDHDRAGLSRTVTGCGYPLGQNDVVIITQGTDQAAKEGHVGEICIRGTSISPGYWNKFGDPETGFNHVISGMPGYYFRTGDLGFQKHNELFITGRIKELMIIRGKNFYPQDIEATIESCHPLIVKNACAAFSVELAEKEELCIVQEIEKVRDADYSEVMKSIRASIAKHHEINPAVIKLIKKGTIPRTSSGKIQRWVARLQLQENTLHLLYDEQNADEKEPKLDSSSPDEFQNLVLSGFKKAFKNEKIGLHSDFFELGGDSLLCVEIVGSLNDRGISVAHEDIYEYPNIEKLCNYLQINKASRDISFASATTKTHNKEAFFLSPQQKRYWKDYLLDLPGRSWSNIFREMEVAHAFAPDLFTAAMKMLVERHESLRTGFIKENDDVLQKIKPVVDFNIDVFDLCEESEATTESILSKLKFESSRYVFDLRCPPLFKITAIKLAPEKWKLFFVFHHIVCDAYSLQILEREAFSAYSALLEGHLLSIVPPEKTFIDYSEWLNVEYRSSSKREKDKEFWMHELKGTETDRYLPFARNSTPFHEDKRGRCIQLALPIELLNKARTFSKLHSISLFCLVLSGFYIELSAQLNVRDLIIGSPAVGRDSEVLNDIVGLFINLVLIRTKIEQEESFLDFSKKVQKKVLQVLSHQLYQIDEIAKDLGVPENKERFPFTTVFLSSLKFETDMPRWTHGSPVYTSELPNDVRFEMMTYVLEYNDGVILDCKFREALMSDAQVVSFLNGVVNKLEYFLDNPLNGVTQQ